MKTKPKQPRIDGMTYANGSQSCVVVIPGRGVIYETRRYRREDADGTPPAFRALREAQRWLAAQDPVAVLDMTVLVPEKTAAPSA